MAFVGHAQVAHVEELATQLSDFPVGEPSYYLLQRPDQITDWQMGRPLGDEIQSFSMGRLFGERAEVRWKTSGSGFSLLWLSEADLPDGFQPLGTWYVEGRQTVHLHGSPDKNHPDQWRETRIPRPLRYPLPSCDTPRLEVIGYIDSATHTARFTRFCRFVQGG